MNNFFKSVLATFIGMFLFFAVVGILGAMSLVGIVASSSATTKVKENSVLVLHLDGSMDERSTSDPLSIITSGETESLGLDAMVSAIKKAASNENIKGIYLDCGSFAPDSYASLEELRRALENFKSKGKWIVAYGDQYGETTYYLASLADKVLLNSDGMIEWDGMASQPMFFKDVLAKFGVKIQLSKVGKYKSAPEQFTADGMSEPNREQVTAYVQGIWNNVVAAVAKSRKLTPEQLNKYADDFIMTAAPKDYVKFKLVDQLVCEDEVKGIVKNMMKLEEDDKVNTVSLSMMSTVKDTEEDGDKEIAVYYAYGDIVDSESQNIAGNDGHSIIGSVVAQDLIDLANDDDVKAVVIRVNSGGGSAHASEKMWQAVKKLKAKKPVVVSMGGMAASGGYYMSCLANWIVAEKSTITGSIGIFGMFPDFSELLTNKLGVKFDLVKTNAHSEFGTRARPFSAEEIALLDKYITRGYDQFLSRVAEGRKMKKEQVNEIAQGRVWLGQDAIKIGLVDEIGGLDKAIEKAAKLAKLEKNDYYTADYPAEDDFLSSLLDKGSQRSLLDEELKSTLGDLYAPFMFVKNIDRQDYLQARVPFCLNIK